MKHESVTSNRRIFDRVSTLAVLQRGVYGLTVLLGLSLLATGSIAIIAEVKGTWHWQIHLESMISYMAIFVIAILVVLIPLYLLLVVARLRRSQ